MQLKLIERAGTRESEVLIHHAVIAGWTGRDQEAMEKHIVELEALGVARPAATPMYYRVAASRLTTAPTIEVSGGDSSGEVEFVLLRHEDRWWVGIGSDHTDRQLETIGVAISKQLCEKPVGDTWWAWDDIAGHWDSLMLRSWIVEEGCRIPYQEGVVTVMRDPAELIAGYEAEHGVLPNGAVMFCGTLAAIGGIRPSETFELELHDPVLQRSVGHVYHALSLPIAG